MGSMASQDLTMDQGCTWGGVGDVGSSLTWAQKATPSSAAVLVDLTGYTAAMKVRSLPGGTVLLSLTQAAGITLGGALGTIVISVSAAQTAAMPAGTHRYDLLLTSGAGVVTKFLEGACLVKTTISVA